MHFVRRRSRRESLVREGLVRELEEDTFSEGRLVMSRFMRESLVRRHLLRGNWCRAVERTFGVAVS